MPQPQLISGLQCCCAVKKVLKEGRNKQKQEYVINCWSRTIELMIVASSFRPLTVSSEHENPVNCPSNHILWILLLGQLCLFVVDR